MDKELPESKMTVRPGKLFVNLTPQPASRPGAVL